ncbi:MAG: hypothetical protein OEV06_03355 [Anaerolineae bacterium]|nr:hypothetical protein [Anaerolineae bacterium]
MKKKRILLTMTLLLAALALSGCSFITTDGRVLFGESFTLPNSNDGGVLNDSVVVFGGDVDIAEDTKVIGDVVVFGGNVNMAGEVTNNLVLFGGDLSMEESALVRRDLVTFGSTVDRASGARVQGQVVNEVPEFDMRDNWNWDVQPNIVQTRNWAYSGVSQVFSYMLNTVAFTALAVLVALFLPKQLETTSKAVSAQPFTAGGLGCLTFIAVPILALIMIITIILIPVSAAGVFLLVAAAVFGWIAVGLNIGQRLAEALDQEWTPIIAAGVGTLTLGIVTGGIGFIPCVGAIISLSIAAIGLGAVMVTRFGTQLPVSVGPEAEVLPATLPEPEAEAKPKAKPKVKSKAKPKAKPKSKSSKPKSTKKKED